MSDYIQKLNCPHCDEEFLFEKGSLAGLTLACPKCGEPIQMPGVQAPQRAIRDDALDFDCEIYGHHPVQAEGRVQGNPFYFRAKWDFWTFTVCTNSDNQEIPSCINPRQDENGFFEDGEYRGYYLSESFGSDTAASYMELDVAEAIIRDCVERFVEALCDA